MSKNVKRNVVIICTSFLISALAVVIAYLLLHENARYFATFCIGFCVFFTAQCLALKITSVLAPRKTSFDEKMNYGALEFSKGVYSYNIDTDISLSFELSESALVDILEHTDDKTFFAVSDVHGSKVASQIVKKIVDAAFQNTNEKENLALFMEQVDSSIRLLNMKGVKISVFVGVLDLTKMKMRFVNGSVYDVFFHKDTDVEGINIPLISNKYVIASEKYLPFVETEYDVARPSAICIKHGAKV